MTRRYELPPSSTSDVSLPRVIHNSPVPPVPERQLRKEQELLNEELYRAAHPRVVELISQLQQAHSPEEFMLVHRSTLAEFGARQEATTDVLPRAKGEAAARIAELALVEPKPVQLLAEQQTIISRVNRQKRVTKAVQHILREVGDGIAWRALRYDRRAFAVLGRGQRVGRLAGGVGRDAEFAELGRLWDEEGVFAIHNDMTNCLRHGDLTAIRDRDGQIDVTLIEVKAGASRDDVQLERLAQATQLLREGRLIGAGTDGAALRLTRVDGSYETYLDQLVPLLATTRERGYEWIKLDDSLLVGAADYRIWGADPDRFNQLSQERRAEVAWPPDQPETLAWTSSLKRMRDRSESFSSIAPFAIYPLPAEDVADLSFGFMDIVFALDLPALERQLAEHGVNVIVARPPASRTSFLTARRRALELQVPPHLREQMMVELMTPTALARALTAVLDEMETEPATVGDSRIVVFEDETHVWESR